ncbi:hypothetical protein [Streptomyces doebereineriae]|uniref:Uncharacterized protein n=1 Tax=Streptomyces doebereineriae TaxID=3075528 RepID=A0ABU2VHU0_9ACTN|nr:hypothetical protein [Streptomyces sp. DSM 41640]MDT0484681.1 hypothetical protein [Streptomyces sp. DSM 41640]
MEWVVASGMVLGLLAVTLGMAAIRTGWTLPWVRRRVTRPRIYGLAGLLVGALCVIQGLFYFHVVPSPSWEFRFFGTGAVMFSGPILMGVSQMRRRAVEASEQTGQADAPRPS